jgi:pilus assembly protein CpaB
MRTRPTPLRPLVRDRLRQLLTPRGWPRLVAPRRLLAALLVLLAAVLALRPPPQARGEPTVPMLVAARDLAPGSSLRAGDVRVVDAPEPLRPEAALTAADQARGRMLAAPLARGEPLTPARLFGAENSRLTSGDPSAVAVPVRLADPEVSALLSPGARVDIVTTSPDDGSAVLLAAGATVVAVRADGGPDHPGRLVVIAVPRREATRLASVTLEQPVAVTLR